MGLITVTKCSEVVWLQGLGSALLVNTDLVNPVYVDTSSSVNAFSTQIPPLGSVAVDGSRTWWAVTVGTGDVVLQVTEGASQWSPSPAQVATQISALGLAKDATLAGQTGPGLTIAQDVYGNGVPLVTKSIALLNQASQAIAAGTNWSATGLNPVSIPQIGYEIYVSLTEAANSATAGICIVTLTWLDAVTGATVDVQNWYLYPGAVGHPHIIRGTGPTHGDQLQITVYNNDSVTVNAIISLLNNSRVYQRDDWRTYNMTGINGFVLETVNDLPGLALGGASGTSIAAAGNAQFLLPLYAGVVTFYAHSGSATSDLTVLARNQGEGENFYQNVSDAHGTLFDTLAFPRSQIKITLTNGNAATKLIDHFVTVQQQG